MANWQIRNYIDFFVGMGWVQLLQWYALVQIFW